MAKNVQVIKNGDVNQFSKLMQNEDKQVIDINIRDDCGNPLFFHLLNSKNGEVNLKIIKLFAQFDAEFDLKNAKSKTLLHEIIKTKNVAATEAVLEWSRSSLVDIKDGEGASPLHIATEIGNEDIVRLLARFRANLDIKYKDGNILLGKEIISGNNSMASLLIKLKADPNIKNDQGETPLHLAVKYGRCTIIKDLLDMGADPYLTDGNGKIPLDYAFEEKKIHIIEAFAQKKIGIDYEDQFGNTMLVKAVGIEDSDPYDHTMVNQLIRLGVDYNALNEKGESIVKKLIKNGDLHSLELILNQNNLKKEIINREGKSWAKIAIENENVKIMELLLKKGISLPSGLISDNPVIKDILEQHYAELQRKPLEKKRKEKMKDGEEDEDTDADSEDESSSSSSSNSDTEEIEKKLYSSDNVRVNKAALPRESDNKTEKSSKNESTSVPFIFDSPNVMMGSPTREIMCQKQSVPVNDEKQLVFANDVDEGEQSYLSATEEHKECPDNYTKKSWMESAASNSSSSFSNLPRSNLEGSQSTDEESSSMNGIGEAGSSFSDLDSNQLQ